MKNSSKKRPYRAIQVNDVRVAGVLEDAHPGRLVVAIDIAKEKMVAAVMDDEESVLVTVRWSHPKESAWFYTLLEELGRAREIQVAMEPTGTYGDALRAHILNRGFSVYQVSPNRVHDAKEVYDGVRSSHDGKACGMIGMLHLSGRSRLFVLTIDVTQETAGGGKNHAPLRETIAAGASATEQYVSSVLAWGDRSSKTGHEKRAQAAIGDGEPRRNCCRPRAGPRTAQDVEQEYAHPCKDREYPAQCNILSRRGRLRRRAGRTRDSFVGR